MTSKFSFFLFLLSSILSPLLGQDLHLQVNTDLPKTDSLSGKLLNVEWFSSNLHEQRDITIYEPPSFQQNLQLPVLIVTDGACNELSKYIEPLILSKKIHPILIVGLNKRKFNDNDSIINTYGIDIRALEYLDVDFMFSKTPVPDSIIPEKLKKRHNKYSKYLEEEVISYLESHYNVSKDRAKWILGGFSNGASFTLSFTQQNPDLFGNVILLSPADINSPEAKIVIKKNAPAHYLAAGIKETRIFDYTSSIVKVLNKNSISNQFLRFDAGHDYKMWIDAYCRFVEQIYKV